LFEVHFPTEKTPCAVKSSWHRLAPPPSPVRPSRPIFLTAGRRRRRRSSPGAASNIGGQVGYAWGSDPIDVVDTVFGDRAFLNDKPTGVIGGAHLGYNLQIAQWVVGLEGSVDGTSLHGTRTSATGITMSTRPDVQGSIRGRLGVAFDRVLIYGTGGAAFSGITNDYSLGFPFFLQETITKTRTRWTVGGGLEYAITNNWSIRAEYRYSDFGRSPDFPFSSITFGNVSFTHHLTENQVQAGFSYKFSPFAPAPVVAKY
jgi:outer membrane immunogenic protein